MGPCLLTLRPEFHTCIKMFKSEKKWKGMAFWAKGMAWANENFRNEMGWVVRRPRPEGQKDGKRVVIERWVGRNRSGLNRQAEFLGGSGEPWRVCEQERGTVPFLL